MSNPRKKASLYLFSSQAQCLFTVVQYIVELEIKVFIFICIYLAVEYTNYSSINIG